jgi:hypothetical protein
LSSNWGGTYVYLPLSIRLGAGKYFSRHHYVGINTDIAINSSYKKYYAVALNYKHQYDAKTSNKALYIPVELQFTQATFDNTYQVADTTFDVQSGGTVYYFPSDFETDQQISAIGFSIGHGISFIKQKKKSFSIELNVFNNFIIQHQFIDLDRVAPNSIYKNSGLKCSFFYNF